MTNEDAIVIARALDAELARRIEAFEIPPPPARHAEDGTLRRRWYDDYVRCTTPAHVYSMRERGSTLCAECLGILLPNVDYASLELRAAAAFALDAPPGFDPHVSLTGRLLPYSEDDDSGGFVQ